MRIVFIILIFTVCALKSLAQDNSLLNSSWADSIRASIQDSIRNKNKAAAIRKSPAPIIKDSVSALKKNDTTHTSTANVSIVKNPINNSEIQSTITDSSLTTAVNDSALQNAANDSIAAINKLKNDSIAKASLNIQKRAVAKPGMVGSLRTTNDTDLVFYVLIFIIFFLALVKNSFPKYFDNIFSLSFQATFRQTQTREQMSQNFFPSFMLNVLFVLSGGVFITLFAQFNKWTSIPFWQLFVYSTSILAVIYTVKYFVILFTGWVFNAADAAAEYGFIVFLINKLLGILFIPILFVIAYSNNDIKRIGITVALCLAGLLICVRYLVSLARIRKNLNLPAFHFFIYLCAIEIMPLLVIYKLLFLRTENT